MGLSTTLPNYADVATLLRVNPKKGMFFFDHSYRPVPLQMQYLGITERNAFWLFRLQNEVCFEKALSLALSSALGLALGSVLGSALGLALGFALSLALEPALVSALGLAHYVRKIAYSSASSEALSAKS